jgi:ankyrin repeat protein
VDDSIDLEAVHWAAQNGDVARLQELVASGHAINGFDELGLTPLHYAGREGHYEAARFLIQSGADVNAHDEASIGDTPLGDIAGNCSLEMARLLVDAGADPTIPGGMQITALHQAQKRKRGDGPQVYELLLSTVKRRRGDYHEWSRPAPERRRSRRKRPRG